MREMTASHDKMASVMVWMQELLEKQGKLASLWKLQEYYSTANQFDKMSSVMTQIKALTESLTQNNDEPDDVIDIDSYGSDDDEIVDGDFGNNNDFEVESAGGHDVSQVSTCPLMQGGSKI